MRKISAFLIAVLFVISSLSVTSFCVEDLPLSVTNAPTPVGVAKLKFSKKFGVNFKAAPTPPIVVGDSLLLVSGMKLYKLDAQTGEEIAGIKLSGSTLYATTSPLYADGKVFVSLDGGIVQALDFQSLETLWIYKDPLEGQAICPITYSSGYIYTGFWNDETEYANYVCLKCDESSNTTKTAQWTYKALGGFYWAGCSVSDKFVVFGKDDGQKGSVEESEIVAVNKFTGEKVSTLKVEGDIRSTVTYSNDNDAYYVSSKSGYVYKFCMDKETGVLSSLVSFKTEGSITASPIVYNNRLYIGYQSETTGKFAVLNAQTMEEIYSCEMLGYPQNTMLLSTAYEQTTSKVYIYSTYNALPGGITVFEDSTGQTSPRKTELFKPDDSQSQYCISTISVGNDGTLYYKNDSGYIFAVSSNENVVSIAERIASFLLKIIDRIKIILKGH